MNISFRQLLSFQGVLVAVAMSIESGCGESQSVGQESHITWDSPKMLEIKREWDSLWDRYMKSPDLLSGAKKPWDIHGELVRMQGDLLRKRLSDSDVRQLALDSESLPVHWRDWSNSDRAVVEFMLDVLVYSRDRDRLLTLLSTRFPLCKGKWPIEQYLARQVKLNNPILILGEAFAKCRVPEVRHDIAAAVRRAFGGFGIIGKDDEEYVANAMQWYDKNKQQLTINTGYSDVMWPIEPVEGRPGMYEEIWSHAKLFTTKQDERQSASSANPSDYPKSRTQGKPFNEAFPKRGNGDRAENKLARLNGRWELVEATDNGEPIPQERIKGFQFVFHKGTLQWTRPDGKKEDEFRVRLIGPQEPSAIDLLQMPSSVLKKEQATALIHELQEETTAAIYELNGDTLRMCLPRRGAWQRPSSFKAEKGSRETSYTLKRIRE